MAAMCLPTLDTYGYLTDKNVIILKVLEYYFTSMKDQSFLFEPIYSLNYRLKEYKDDLEGLKEAIVDDLTAMYENYFTNADVTIKEKDVETDDNKTIKEYQIDVECKDNDGNVYTLSRTLTSLNNVTEIDDLLTFLNNTEY